MATPPAAAPQLMGVRIKRREDPALITGEGKYTGDIQLDNIAYMALLRSPHAHAEIRSIDTSAAKEIPGVVTVLTGADINPHIAGPLPVIIPFGDAYSDHHGIDRTLLAEGKVRHVGDPVAVVVADSKYAAADALDAIKVRYKMLPAVVDPEQAMNADAPVIHDEIGRNIAFRWAGGNDVDDAFANADKVVELRIANQRLLPTAMEPRAVTANYDATDDQFTLWTSTQVPHTIKGMVAGLLGVDAENVRVIAPEVGGGFGAKSNIFCEEVLAPYLAKQVGRPIK